MTMHDIIIAINHYYIWKIALELKYNLIEIINDNDSVMLWIKYPHFIRI